MSGRGRYLWPREPVVEVIFHLVVLGQAEQVAVLHVHQVLRLWGGTRQGGGTRNGPGVTAPTPWVGCGGRPEMGGGAACELWDTRGWGIPAKVPHRDPPPGPDGPLSPSMDPSSSSPGPAVPSEPHSGFPQSPPGPAVPSQPPRRAPHDPVSPKPLPMTRSPLTPTTRPQFPAPRSQALLLPLRTPPPGTPTPSPAPWGGRFSPLRAHPPAHSGCS